MDFNPQTPMGHHPSDDQQLSNQQTTIPINQQNKIPQGTPPNQNQQIFSGYPPYGNQYQAPQQGYPYPGQQVPPPYYGQPMPAPPKPSNPQKVFLKKVANRVGLGCLICVAGYALFSYLFLFLAPLITLLVTGQTQLIDQMGLFRAILYTYQSSTELQWAMQLFVSVFGCGVAILSLRKMLNIKIKSFFHKPEHGLRYIAQGSIVQLGISMAASMALTILTSLCLGLMGDVGGSISSPDFSLRELNPITVTLYLLSLLVVAPIFEEILFRGFVLRALQRYGNIFAIAVSSICFGLYHGNLSQFVPTAIGACIMGYIAVKSNSLIPGMVIHLINNLISTVQVLAIDYLPDTWSTAINVSLNLLIFGGAILILILNAKRISLKNNNMSNLSNGECVAATIATPGMILFLVYSLWQIITYFF